MQMTWGFTALACLYVVGLSVSRSALMGTALGVTLAFRHVLGTRFAPVLIFVIAASGLFSVGMFDQIISNYSLRGTEETGRLLVWPLALGRFIDAPLLGVGADAVNTYVPGRRNMLSPHNSFIWFGLAAGIVPLILFVGWWIRIARRALRRSRDDVWASYRLPFLAHTLIFTVAGDLGFMQPWAVLALCIAAAPVAARTGVPYYRRSIAAPSPVHSRVAMPAAANLGAAATARRGAASLGVRRTGQPAFRD
jgi:O-antigen ligase